MNEFQTMMFGLCEDIAADDGIDVDWLSRMSSSDDHAEAWVTARNGDVFSIVLVGDYHGELLCEVARLPFDLDGDVNPKLAQVVSFSTLQAV